MHDRATELVGRDQELGVLAELAAKTDQLPRAVVLQGEAGIGKTALWQAGAELAAATCRVLSTRPAETEAQISFAAVSDLLVDLLEEALAELPPPQRRALEIALRVSDPDRAAPDRTAIALAFLGALRTLSRPQPLMLAIDDVQWLDPQSRLVLTFACRRLRDDPVALLVALRHDDGSSTPLELHPALGVDRVQHLELRPLSIGALQELFRARLGVVFRRPALRRIHETSGGNPFYALELAGALQGDAAPEHGRPIPLPKSLQELVVERLQALPGSTRAVLEVAALLSEPTFEVLDAALGCDVRAALAPAVEAGIVELRGDRIRFTHPLRASAITTATKPSRAREIHLRLSELAADAEARARHLALGSAHPDAEVAATLELAAHEVAGRGAPMAAAELLEHSLRLTPESESDGWARRALAAAELYEPAGDTARSQALAAEVLERVEAGPRRAEALIIRSYWDSSAEIADEAVAHAAGEPGVLSRALYSRARASFNRGDVRSAVGDARRAVELAGALDDLVLLAAARAELGRLELMLGRPSAHATLERARADRRRAGVTGPIYFSAETWLACERLWRDDVDGARQLFEERRVLALEEDDVDALGGVLVRLVEVEWRAGNSRTAAEHARRNVELAEQRGNFQRAAVLYARALVDTQLGELDTAERDAGEALRIAESTGNNVYLVYSLCVLAAIAASRGDHERVLESVGDLAERLNELGFEHPGCCVYAGDELEALVVLGLHERAEMRIEELERRGQELDLARTVGYAYRARGLLAAARGDVDAAAHSLSLALEQHERIPVPFERARTLLAFGMTLRRGKQKRAAREMLERALALFEELGAAVWAETTRAELGRIPGRRPAGGGLTPSEQRIAELVAEGKSNKQVAAELFVTVSTVEAALTRVYEKLGIRSRTELARRLPAEPQPS